MNYKEIGKQIKRKRIENKLRQEDLAEMADLSTGYIKMCIRDSINSLSA